MGGIVSRTYLEKEQKAPDLIINDSSNSLDLRQNLGVYVQLSFIGDNYMYKTFLERSKNDFVIILISPLVLFYHAFLMSNQNAAANNACIDQYKIIKIFLDFNRLYSINKFPQYCQ